MDVADIDRVAVLGAGNMGHGIAEVAAIAGFEVTMRDISEDLVRQGIEDIEWSLDKLVEHDRLTEAEAGAALDRVTPVVELDDAVGEADFVIEAVPERMDVKREVYAEVSEHAPDRAVFASNTSSLSITELSEATDRPERFCGMHFFNPPVRMELVEVIAGDHTDEAVLDLASDLAEAMGKTPVRVRKDSPGFIVNRVAVPAMNEAAWLVHEGEATIAEVDATSTFDMGLPMGTFELTDLVGIDVAHDVLAYVHAEVGDAYEPCPLLAEKVEAEELGQKTGEGFYDYEDGGASIPTDEGRDDLERLLLGTMANEVAKLVGDGVATVAEIDEAVRLGLGYPDGPAKMADAYGLDALVETLDERRAETGHARYEVAGGFRTAAEAGGFYGGGEESASEFETVRLDLDGHVGRITLDRPHRLNTITVEMLEELDAAVDEFETDADVRAILLIGAGDRAFSAGADQNAFSASSAVEAIDLSRRGQRTFGRLEVTSMPVVAAIDGYCLGGGMELATCADLRIASRRSNFGQPEHSLGLLPGWGGTQRLARIVGEGRAKEIIFTARKDYDAETMSTYGFVNEVVANDDLEERALELTRDLAAGPPIAQALTKRAIRAGRDGADAGFEVEAAAFGHLFNTDDLWEGLAAFAEDRDPEFEGR